MADRRNQRSSIAVGFVVAFLIVQVSVPSLALFADRPARFGWQMYASMPRLPHAWLVHDDGREEAVNLETLFATQRAEVDYEGALQRALCARTSAASVRIEPPGEAPPVTVDCH